MAQSVAILGTRGYPSYYGGFETAVRKLAPYLADSGWDVTVYGRPDGVEVDDPDLDARVNRVITRGIESKALSTLSYGFTATVHAIRHRPDVVLIMNVANGYWLPLLKLFRIPTVINVDGMEWERAKWGRLAKFVFKTGARLTALFGDDLIVDSTEIGRRWEAEFKRGGTHIPYGGDPISVLELEPGLTSRGYVLFVARFVPENSVDAFIDAVELLDPAIPVVVVGSSGYGSHFEHRLLELSQHRGGVHLLGHISDDPRLASLWQHAGAYFHGHSVGGTNPALVQAMASGAPVVARDTVYNREVLASGAVFVQPDPKEIAAALERVMGDPELQTALSTAGKDRATASYSWDPVCAAYEIVIHSQIRHAGQPPTFARSGK